MSIDLHHLLGSFKFQPPLLESHLNLLSEDLTFICIMRRGIMLLEILHVLELVLRWDLVIWFQLNQPFRQ